MNHKIPYLLLLLLTIPLIQASTQTYQYAKIYSSPYYRLSMTNGQNYTSTLEVNPPDGITKVINAIINLDAYITPTVTFNMTINNKSCNTNGYTISTTFATAGQAHLTFDCSNVITKKDNYTITIRPTQANTGASTTYLDLTYMNNPPGTASVSGTEYRTNEQATIFVQLKDANGNPIQNGSCYTDIYYPLNSTSSHPYTIRDAPMLTATGDDGIYYYDLITPNITGVYMVSAKCSYTFNKQWYYRTDDVINPIIRQNETGTWIGTTITLNDPADSGYETATRTGGNPIIANYTWNTSVYGTPSNITQIEFYYLGQSSTAGTATFQYLNSTGGLITIPNTLTYQATGSSTPQEGKDQYYSTTIPSSAIINNIVKIRATYTGTGTWYVHNEWLALSLLSNVGTIQDVKGSSELHVNNWFDTIETTTRNNSINLLNINTTITTIQNTTQANNNLLTQIWTYLTGTITNWLDQINNRTITINTTTTTINRTIQGIANQSISVNTTKEVTPLMQAIS